MSDKSYIPTRDIYLQKLPLLMALQMNQPVIQCNVPVVQNNFVDDSE